MPHFHSVHAYLGTITLALLAIQYLFGLTILLPPLQRLFYRSTDRAKSLWKYHRMLGYLVFILLLATVAAAAETDYNKAVLSIRLWSVLAAEGLVLAGVGARVHRGKMFGRR